MALALRGWQAACCKLQQRDPGDRRRTPGGNQGWRPIAYQQQPTPVVLGCICRIFGRISLLSVSAGPN